MWNCWCLPRIDLNFYWKSTRACGARSWPGSLPYSASACGAPAESWPNIWKIDAFSASNIPQRVSQARLEEPLQPQSAGVALAAGHPLLGWIIAGMCQGVVHPQFNPLSDDV